MKYSISSSGLGLVALTSALLFAGCKPAPDETKAKAPASVSATGLTSEKQKVSYMIGLQMAKSLEPAKDEIDVDLLAKTIKSSLAGEKPVLDQSQLAEIGQVFGEKMKAKLAAKAIEDANKNLSEGRAFLDENAKKPGVKKTESGLQYQVLTLGKGAKPKESDMVRVHYTGTLLNGETFDSSYARGEPMIIPLAGVVPGWREGLALMPVGSKFRLWLPAELGYGKQGTQGGPIGPNATLLFDVELLEIVDPAQVDQAAQAVGNQ